MHFDSVGIKISRKWEKGVDRSNSPGGLYRRKQRKREREEALSVRESAPSFSWVRDGRYRPRSRSATLISPENARDRRPPIRGQALTELREPTRDPNSIRHHIHTIGCLQKKIYRKYKENTWNPVKVQKLRITFQFAGGIWEKFGCFSSAWENFGIQILPEDAVFFFIF